jgi:hypothetical protein
MNTFMTVCNDDRNAVWKRGVLLSSVSQDETNWRAAQGISRMRASKRLKQESELFRACGTLGAQAKVQAFDKK